MKQILEDYSPILNVTPEDLSLEEKPLQTKTAKKQTKLRNTSANPTSTETPKHTKAQSVKIPL